MKVEAVGSSRILFSVNQTTWPSSFHCDERFKFKLIIQTNILEQTKFSVLTSYIIVEF